MNWRLSSKVPILAPGDSTPTADQYQDYLDYRGVALEKNLKFLKKSMNKGVSLGNYVKPNYGKGKTLWLDPDNLQTHCAVIGPPGAGKTEGIIIPWIIELLEQGYSVVTVDIKGDLIDQLGRTITKLGCQVWYWNSSDTRSQSWNWLSEIKNSRDIESAVQSILGKKKDNDPQPFFYDRDYRWLRTLINIVKTVYGEHAQPLQLYLLITDQEEIRQLFRLHPSIRGYANEIAELFTFTIDEYSRAVSGLSNALHLFNDLSVIKVSDHSDFKLDNICNKPTLLIVGASLADAQQGEILSSIMINQLFNYVYSRFGSSTPSLPLYFILDESSRLKDRINFEEVLSVCRSAKVGICLAAQNVTQFGDERQSSSILNNCSTMIVLQGCSIETVRYFSNRLGTRSEKMVSTSIQRGVLNPFSNHGVNVQIVTVPVLNEREIMHPPQGKYCAIAQVRTISPKPFIINLERKISEN